MAIKPISFDKVNISGGFWKERQELVRNTTVHAVYDRFKESGRFDAFKLDYKEGDSNRPHIYWDSDVAKWMEAVAYLTAKKREPELEAIVDGLADDIERGRTDDGYFNIWHQLFRPGKRFYERDNHELYCAGHLLEAAVAYDKATGKDKLLRLMKDYMRLVKKIFITEKSAAFATPGHEEIELALIKLYDHTGEREWLDMAIYFIEARGGDKDIPDPNFGAVQTQSHLPVRQMKSAEGHAVRAMYLFTAMADIAERTGDNELFEICRNLFANVTEKKMYITGGIGSSYTAGEAFDEEYRLPNDTAYAETCAALALALFAGRMSALDADSRYADTVERVIYNGFLSGISLDGRSFFYENANEIDLGQRERIKNTQASTKNMHFPITKRVELFYCSCCPPNIARFIPSVGGFVYSSCGERIYVHQYMESDAEIDGVTVVQKTDYPYSGRIDITVNGGKRTLALRIPAWCDEWTVSKNGTASDAAVEKGYAVIDVCDGDTITLMLTLKAQVVKASPDVVADRGLSAVTYGPFVMCMEGIDNGGVINDVRVTSREFTKAFDGDLGTFVLETSAVHEYPAAQYSSKLVSTPFTARFIPYYAFANRGETNMRIWVDIDR